MVNFCCVVGCSNRSNRDNVSFYGIPTISLHHGEFKRKLSKERREKWLESIGRQNWKPSKSSRVCSRHFVGGKPAYLQSFDHPAWIPTLYMDGSSPSHPTTALSMKRSRKRKRKEADVANALLDLPKTLPIGDDDWRKKQGRIRYVITRGVQTDIKQIDLAKKIEQLEEYNTALRKKVRKLEKKVKSTSVAAKKLTKNRDRKGELYTGLPSWTAHIPCSALPHI